MPNDLTLPVIPGTLPSGFCPVSYQDMLNTFSANQSVTFPSTFSGIIVSSTAPSDTTKAWLQLDSFGRPVRLYFFASGAWLSMHPMVPGFTTMWTTTLPTMSTFDGGDANPLSAISGPMWEVVTAFAARSPIGVGTLPSGTAINVGDQLGEEKHLLVSSEGAQDPNHTHVTGRFVNAPGGGDEILVVGSSTTDAAGRLVHGGGTAATVQLSAQAGDYTKTTGVESPTTPVAHQTVHPVLGVYLLRRTNRLFYTV